MFTKSILFAFRPGFRDNGAMTLTRRERLRAETIDEIKAAALAQIARSGGPSLTIRGVAREIGMSPAGLYRYYDGLDDLLTDLITDAYNDLATAVEGATSPRSPDGLAATFAAGVSAYRDWAVANPNRFLLIFGTPIPGYAAPEGGPTVAAHQRVGRAFFVIAAEAAVAGELTVAASRAPTQGEEAFVAEVRDDLPGLSAPMVGVLLGTWAHWHGLIALEVTRQLDWIYPDDRDAFFDGELQRMTGALGFAG